MLENSGLLRCSHRNVYRISRLPSAGSKNYTRAGTSTRSTGRRAPSVRVFERAEDLQRVASDHNRRAWSSARASVDERQSGELFKTMRLEDGLGVFQTVPSARVWSEATGVVQVLTGVSSSPSCQAQS